MHAASTGILRQTVTLLHISEHCTYAIQMKVQLS